MSNTRHTPGPWAVVAACDVPRDLRLLTVCASEPNAHLLAAAPDLLAACEYLYGQCLKPDPPDMAIDRFEEIRQLIAEAKGA